VTTVASPSDIPMVDAYYPPEPTPAGSRTWPGFSLGHKASGGWLPAGAEQTVLVVGPPRSGKTSAIVIPCIWGAPAAVVSTSTKADVLEATYDYRRRLGTCYVFDPTSSATLPESVVPLRWSPLVGCQSFEAAVARAHALAGAGRPGAGHSESAHWVERAEALLAPLLHAAALAGKTMREVCAWVLGHDVREAEAVLTVSGAQMAKVTLSSVWRTEERERSGIFSTTAGLLSAYRSEAALASASEPNFDADRFAVSCDTVYVCAPAYAQDQLAPLVVALLEQIRVGCYQRRRRFPDAAPTLFVLDEVANIAPLPTLPQLASEGVSQGVVTMACLQDLSQARSRWGAAADGFFSLFGTKLIFPGIADHGTLELISALMGDVEVPTQSVSAPVLPDISVAMAILKRLALGPPRTVVDRTPVITRSTIFRRRMPVDEVYRGQPGCSLALRPAGPMYAHATPWWELEKVLFGPTTTVGTDPNVPGPPAPLAQASPWDTPGARVIARSSPGWLQPWIVTVRGDPLPPSLPAAAFDQTGAEKREGAAIAVATVLDRETLKHAQPPSVHKAESDRDVTVRVLGPVEVTGWIHEPGRRVVTELACFLALHADRKVTGEEMRAALWPGDLGASEASAKSLRNTVSLLRKALGPNLVPDAQKGSGYRLGPGVLCDWATFSHLVEDAKGPVEKDKLRQALSLVRGSPFEGVAPGSFSWAWTELFVSRMEVAVASAASRLGETALAEGDIEMSVWAVLQGLSSSPYDRGLWSIFLQASARSGRDALERAWKSAVAVLGDDSRELAEVIDDLRIQE
jgi:type IV secretion system protein VirD4